MQAPIGEDVDAVAVRGGGTPKTVGAGAHGAGDVLLLWRAASLGDARLGARNADCRQFSACSPMPTPQGASCLRMRALAADSGGVSIFVVVDRTLCGPPN